MTGEEVDSCLFTTPVESRSLLERIASASSILNRSSSFSVAQTILKRCLGLDLQLVPYRPTDDEVVHSKHLGHKYVLVDLYQSNPLIVI